MSFNDGGATRRSVLVALLLVALVALAGCSGALNQGDSASQSRQGGGDGARPTGQQSSEGAGGVGSYYDQGDRVIVRESRMDLRVDNFSESFRDLRTIADRHGGFVGDRRQRSEGEWDSGTVTIRVPARNFSAARDEVAALGELEDENVEVLDFTTEYEDRQSRIQQLEADRQQLRDLMNNTDNASEATRLRDELREVREELRHLRSQQEQLRQRQALSTIRVDMAEPESRKPPETFATAFGFADAFRSAFHGGLTAVKYVIVFFGYAIPIGFAALLLGTFGFGLWRIWLDIQALLERVFGGGDRSSVSERLSRSGDGADDGVNDDSSDDGPDRSDEDHDG